MKKYFLIVLIGLISFLIGTSMVLAHPGKTDKNGGHYCRTNCAKWGLKKGEYHYHKKTSGKRLNLRDAVFLYPHAMIGNLLGD